MKLHNNKGVLSNQLHLHMDLQKLASQLRKPEGPEGRQVGEMMNKGNLLLNTWVIEALQPQEGDNILEIGMGNGYFVKDILKLHPSISYSGIDYSPLMCEEALLLNQELVENKRAFFYTGDASSLPFADNSFSAIMTVNTIYFWEDAEKQMSEIRRVLQPGGRLVIGIRNKRSMEQMPFTEYGFRKFDRQDLLNYLTGHNWRINNLIENKEPPYDFNGTTMEIENIVVSCGK